MAPQFLLAAVTIVQLASTQYMNQEHLAAYMTYAQALDEEVVATKRSCSPTEVFDPIYSLYLQEDGQGAQFQEALLQGLSHYPNCPALRMMQAALFANSGDLPAFFDTYWKAYLPDHFLALKIRGNIMYKILEYSADPETREMARKRAIDFFLKSFSKRADDVSLVSRVILLSRPEEQKMVLSQLMPSLSQLEKPPSRRQCWTLLEIADEMGESEGLYTLMRGWFPESRFLDEWAETHYVR